MEHFVNSMAADGFAIIDAPQRLCAHMHTLLAKARPVFGSETSNDSELLKSVVQRYTSQQDLFNDLRRTSCPLLRLEEDEWLAHRFGLLEDGKALVGVSRGFEDFSLCRQAGGFQASSLGELAHFLLFSLISAQSSEGATAVERAVKQTTRGCCDACDFSIFSANFGEGIPASFRNRGFFTILFLEGGMIVREPKSKKVQATGSCCSLLVMTGDLLASSTQGIYRACKNRVAPAHAPSLALLFTLQPSGDARIQWPISTDLPQPRYTQVRYSGNAVRAKIRKMDRAVLMREVMEQYERWIALMMALHPILGKKSGIAKYEVPPDIWESIAFNALGFYVPTEVDDGSSCMQMITAYSALQHAQLGHVLAPAFRKTGLDLDDFKLSMEGGAVSRHRTMRSLKMNSVSRWTAPKLLRSVRTQTLKVNAVQYGLGERSIRIVVRARNPILGESTARLKIMRHEQLGHVKRRFCLEHGHPLENTTFWFKGQEVLDDETPECLGMHNSHTVQAVVTLQIPVLDATHLPAPPNPVDAVNVFGLQNQAAEHEQEEDDSPDDDGADEDEDEDEDGDVDDDLD